MTRTHSCGHTSPPCRLLEAPSASPSSTAGRSNSAAVRDRAEYRDDRVCLPVSFCLSVCAPKKVKVAHTRLPSVGFRSWSRFLAVSLQVTWVINPAIGCHYFPPGLQPPPQPLRGLLPILLLGEQRHNGCESLPKAVTRQRRGCDLNPGPSVPESSTLTTRLPSHPPELHVRSSSNVCACYFRPWLLWRRCDTLCASDFMMTSYLHMTVRCCSNSSLLTLTASSGEHLRRTGVCRFVRPSVRPVFFSQR